MTKCSNRWRSSVLALCLALLFGRAFAGNPEFLIVGLHGEVSAYDSGTTMTRALVTQADQDWRNGVVQQAVIGIDQDSTVTLWVLPLPNVIGSVHPLANAHGYNNAKAEKDRYCFDQIMYDSQVHTVAGRVHPLDASLPGLQGPAFRARTTTGTLVSSNPRADRFATVSTFIRPEFGPYWAQQMRSWFPVHANDIPSTTTAAGWSVDGESSRMRV